MFADTELVTLPCEFDDAEPPAFQCHDTIFLPLPFVADCDPVVNPSVSKDVIDAE